jgi:Protein of unknown function (DUF3631)
VGDDFEPRAFATFSACAIALIGSLPDTLHDRAVVIDLKRRMPSETIEPFRPDRAGYLDVLARKAARWAQDHADKVATADPNMPSGIINRKADNWRPVLAIADAAGGDWPDRARKAAMQSYIEAEDDDASRLELLLGDIRDVFTEKGLDEIASVDLVKALIAIEGRPWAELGKSRKPLTQNRLARLLKPLPVIPENIRVGDKVPKGYILKQFEEAFARYLPSEWASEPLHRYKADETGTSEHFQTATKESDVADWKCEKPNNDGHCSVVADGKGGNGQNVRSPLGNEPGLSLRTIRELADAYQERTYAQYQESGSTDVDHRPLDAWLRRQLAELGVFPEFVEIEFKRVMDVVFAI